MGRSLALILFLSFFSTFCSRGPETEIRVGAIFDLTGQTAETGTKYAEGIRNHISYVNEQGGINGRRIRLIEIDTAYMTARDLMAYDELVYKHNVHILLSWSTSGTTAILPNLNRDRVPCFGVSLAGELADIRTAPTYFFIAPTYSDQIKVAFRYIKDNFRGGLAEPEAALIYNDTPFGRSPVEDARKFAREMGITITAEEIVYLDARDAIDQITRIKIKNPSYAIVNETAWAASVILKEAARHKLKTKFIGLVWCADEKVVNLAGRSAEGYMGVFPFLFDPEIPGIKEMIEYNRINELGNITAATPSMRYINGWVTSMIMTEGIRLAGNDVTRSGIIKGLEKMKNFNTGGITTPVTYTNTDHVGYRSVWIGIVDNGKWKIITPSMRPE